MTEITTADKIKSLRREIAMRKNVYPKWIESGRMTKEAADREIAVMQAIHDDYAPKNSTTAAEPQHH